MLTRAAEGREEGRLREPTTCPHRLKSPGFTASRRSLWLCQYSEVPSGLKLARVRCVQTGESRGAQEAFLEHWLTQWTKAIQDGPYQKMTEPCGKALGAKARR